MYGDTRRGSHVRLAAIGIGHDATDELALTAAFDDAILTLASGKTSTHNASPIIRHAIQPEVDGDGNELWQWSAEYRFSVRN